MTLREELSRMHEVVVTRQAFTWTSATRQASFVQQQQQQQQQREAAFFAAHQQVSRGRSSRLTPPFASSRLIFSSRR